MKLFHFTFPKTGKTFYFTLVCGIKVWCESEQVLEDFQRRCKTKEEVISETVSFMEGREGWQAGQRILYVKK